MFGAIYVHPAKPLQQSPAHVLNGNRCLNTPTYLQLPLQTSILSIAKQNLGNRGTLVITAAEQPIANQCPLSTRLFGAPSTS